MAGFDFSTAMQGQKSAKDFYDQVTHTGAYAPTPGIPDLYGSAGTAHPVEGALSLNGDSGLTSRSVHTVPLDMYGNPVQPTVAANGSAVQAIETAVPHASGTLDGGKSTYRLDPTPSYADAFGGNYGAQPATSNGIADLYGALAFGHPALGAAFLGGDPGVTDWTVANQGGAGLGGPITAPYAGAPNPPPAPIAETYAHPAPPKPKPQPALNVTKNIDRYLAEQGYGGNGNGGNMTAGEQANAFRKAMGF